MTVQRQRLHLMLATAAAAVGLASAPAMAQGSYPSKTVLMIVPAAAGGTTDLAGRMAAQALAPVIGQSVVVDNKGGGNGAIAANLVKRADADGYTLLMQYSGYHVISPHLTKARSWEQSDFAPVANVLSAPQIIVVRSELPVKTLAELVSYTKANPGKLNYATSGNGTIVHLNTAAFAAQAGIQLAHVPYKGTAQSITDLAAGQVHLLFDSIPTGMPHVASGRLRALAVTGDRRSTLAPNLPTVAESGLPGYSSVTWFGLYGPAGMKPELVGRINQAFNRAIQNPEVIASLAKQGVEPAKPQTPGQFAAMVQADSARWAKVIRDNHITLE